MMSKRKFFTEKLLVPNTISSSSKRIVAEAEEVNGQLKIRLPATVLDQVNLNSRIYPTDVVQKAMEDPVLKEKMASGYLIGSADDHPETPYVAPINGSHMITDAWVEDIDGVSYLMNDWILLNTTNGKNLRALIEGGASFGVSVRGFGNTTQIEDKEHGVVEVLTNYEFVGTDAVGERAQNYLQA